MGTVSNASIFFNTSIEIKTNYVQRVFQEGQNVLSSTAHFQATLNNKTHLEELGKMALYEATGGNDALPVAAGIIGGVADALLAPVRYLFNGYNVRIRDLVPTSHVRSFHVDPQYRLNSKGNPDWQIVGQERTTAKFIASIIIFIPGLILGSLLKALTYLSSTVREGHRLAKEHLEPIHIEIKENEIDQLPQYFNRKVESLTITGHQTEALNLDVDSVIKLNPKKIIIKKYKNNNWPTAVPHFYAKIDSRKVENPDFLKYALLDRKCDGHRQHCAFILDVEENN